MQYLCPKCGNFMQTVSTASIPAIVYYQCFHCGYKSKSEKEQLLYMTLPEELWSDEEEKDGFNDV